MAAALSPAFVGVWEQVERLLEGGDGGGVVVVVAAPCRLRGEVRRPDRRLRVAGGEGRSAAVAAEHYSSPSSLPAVAREGALCMRHLLRRAVCSRACHSSHAASRRHHRSPHPSPLRSPPRDSFRYRYVPGRCRQVRRFSSRSTTPSAEWKTFSSCSPERTVRRNMFQRRGRSLRCCFYGEQW